METNSSDQNPLEEDQKLQESSNPHNHKQMRNKIGYVIIVAVLFVISIATSYNDTREGIPNWFEDIKPIFDSYPTFFGFSAIMVLVVGLAHILYGESVRITVKNKEFQKGRLCGITEANGEEFQKGKVEGIIIGTQQERARFDTQILSVVEAIEKFRNDMEGRNLGEYTETLIKNFTEHPDSWIKFLDNSLPSKTSQQDRELWEILTMTLIKTHLSILAGIRSGKGFEKENLTY